LNIASTAPPLPPLEPPPINETGYEPEVTGPTCEKDQMAADICAFCRANFNTTGVHDVYLL
jgi:hypothetical protein